MTETELARYRCPRCNEPFDVWLEDGQPEKPPLCPGCKHSGVTVIGHLDEKETELYYGS